ncbi:17985_t:CDS:2, partial [Entrophospora sp. SA101]
MHNHITWYSRLQLSSLIVLGVGPIKPWGVVQKWFFGVTTHDELVARLGLNPGSLLSNDEMDTTTANDTLNEMVLVIDDLSTTTANDQDNEIIKKQVNDGDIPTFTINIFDSGAFLTLYAILFGVGPIKPWGVVQKWFFRTKTHDVLKDRLGSTHVPLFYKNKENSDKNEESSDKNETDVGPIGPWKYLKKWFFITKTHCRLGSILSLFYKKKSGKNETNALMGDYCEEIDASTTTENDKNHQAAIVIDTPTATTNYEIVSEIDESTTTTNDKDDELSLMKNQLDSVTHELSETKQQLDALIELLKHHVVKIPQLKKDEDENKKGKNKKDKGENKKDKDEDEDEIKVLESEIDSIFYAGN